MSILRYLLLVSLSLLNYGLENRSSMFYSDQTERVMSMSTL